MERYVLETFKVMTGEELGFSNEDKLWFKSLYAVFEETETLSQMFGIPLKKAYIVAAHDADRDEKALMQKAIAAMEIKDGGVVVGAYDIHCDRECVIVWFDDTHRVQFWNSEWGGIIRM